MHWNRNRVAALALGLIAVMTVAVSTGYFVLWRSEDRAGNFLFIESRTIIEAEVLEGKWVRFVDFPYYWYNVSTGRIEYSERPFDLDRLLAVYGSLLAYRGAGRGTSSYLYPIYSTPCAAGDGTSIIESIDKDGTARIIYETKQIVLSPNQQWRIENETIEHSKEAVVRFKQTITIENLGFWKKTNISSRILRSLSPLLVSKDPANQEPTRSFRQFQSLNAAKTSATFYQPSKNARIIAHNAVKAAQQQVISF
ncbi:hypothetical protein MUP05_08165 [Candidatus Bathyarchaeota archaeon]|nr:hypothetical protein [Candidatus Bathyarchaeota archaeon]